MVLQAHGQDSVFTKADLVVVDGEIIQFNFFRQNVATKGPCYFLTLASI